VKRKASLVGLLAPIGAFLACDALHGVQLPEEIPWPVEPKPPRIAPDADVDVEDDDAVLVPDPDERHQLYQPVRLPDVVRQGWVMLCGVPCWAVGACCTHWAGGGAR
jgi:hypothetical protein